MPCVTITVTVSLLRLMFCFCVRMLVSVTGSVSYLNYKFVFLAVVASSVECVYFNIRPYNRENYSAVRPYNAENYSDNCPYNTSLLLIIGILQMNTVGVLQLLNFRQNIFV